MFVRNAWTFEYEFSSLQYIQRLARKNVRISLT